MDSLIFGFVRTLCFFHAYEYAPTRGELLAWWDCGNGVSSDDVPLRDIDQVLEQMLATRQIMTARGRFFLPFYERPVEEQERRAMFVPRKMRRARRIATWLQRIGGVRFVALCNSTALANGRDESDIDFFVITKEHSLWQTRGWATLPFLLLGQRANPNRRVRDGACLSFFVDETAMDLSPLQLIDDDPYFRYWFLSLLLLVDDGISKEFWEANPWIRDRHPFAKRWELCPGFRDKQALVRIPSIASIEPLTRASQKCVLSSMIREKIGEGNDVVVHDHVLKFHVRDGRRFFRDRYQELCRTYGVEP